MENNGESNYRKKAMKLATKIADDSETDIYFYSGEINEEGWGTLLT